MRIRTRIILYTLIPLLLLLPMVSWVLLNQKRSSELERLEEKRALKEQFMREDMKKLLVNAEQTYIKQLCSSLYQDPDVLKIKVIDRVNHVLFDKTKQGNYEDYPKIGFPDEAPIEYPYEFENPRSKTARITLLFSTKDIEENIASYRNFMLLSSLALLSILILIYFYLSRLISRPVESIVASLQKVDKGDLNHRLELPNDKEFKTIETHFNGMVSSIKTNKEKLQEANAQLLIEIEERKKATEILSNVMENIPYAIFWKDKELNYIGMNENFAKDNGKQKNKIIGHSNRAVIQPPELIHFYDYTDNEVINEGQTIIEREHTVEKNQEQVYYSTSKVPLYNDEQKITGLVGIYHDITNRKREEQALREAKEAAEAANKAKSEFLANMSHEIRTPMNGIMGMAEILAHTEPSKDQQKYINIIKTSSDSLLQIINDILDISRIEAGKIELSKNAFDLEQLVIRTLDAFAVTAHNKNIDLAYWIEPEVNIALVGDPSRLKQILINIIGNAIKFTDKGEVFLHVENVKSETGAIVKDEQTVNLKFSVIDTGIGIKEEKLEAIFESFTQADNSYSRQYGGTGLGLAISRKLVEMMNGDIMVSSQFGMGSSFSFTAQFDCKKEKQQAFLEKKHKALEQLHVVIANNNNSSSKYLKQALELMGIRTIVLDKPQEIVEYMRVNKDKSAILLMDLYLNEESTTPILEQLNKVMAVPEGVIVTTSAVDARESKMVLDKCKELGVKYFLLRPMKIMELQALLLELTERRKVAQENTTLTEETSSNNIAGKQRKIYKPSSKKILVAEDHAINQNLTRLMLSRIGYSTVIAANGQEAIDKFDDSYALILMDIQMPVVDGIEATNIIRMKENGKEVPIIALTAHAQEGDKERFMKSGMDDYISKPYKPDQFFEVLGRYLSIEI